MKRTLLLTMACCLLTGLMLGCSSYGTRLEYKGSDLYYTKNVTEAEAKKLGDYLVKNEFFTDQNKGGTAQLDKSGDTYQFRMVVKEGVAIDDKLVALFGSIARQISKDVFNGAKVEVHLCDNNLKTLKVVPMA
ncbi:MAG TPA: hypothetical protein VKB86_14765 [Pyrinomonadaceae bacterium]|nr:hypothetical protein [Pyrinomonadaceae bacterium]